MTTTPPKPILGKYDWSVRHVPRFDETETITLHVGPDENPLTAHRNYLTFSSDFFKSALESKENNDRPRIIKLPNESPPIVNAYLRFAYGGGLETAIVTWDLDRRSCIGRTTFCDESHEYYEDLARLYTLGERLQDQSVRAAVIKEVLRLVSLTEDSKRFCPSREAINIIYRGTPEGSHARRLMANIHVAYGSNEMLDLSCKPAFVLDVARAFHTKTEGCTKSKDLRLHGLRERDYVYWDRQHDRLALKPGGVVVIGERLEPKE